MGNSSSGPVVAVERTFDYPTGEFTCASVGTIQKTARRFSARLDKAVKANLGAAGQQAVK